MKNSIIGFTSTIPVELVLSAGFRPTDLNNVFITHENPRELLKIAYNSGFPENICTWITGIYGAVKHFGIKKVIGVLQGDCSNTHVLMEIFSSEGIDIIPFEYPIKPDRVEMRKRLESFAKLMGTDLESGELMRERLIPIRKLLWEIDRLTFEEAKVKGFENHLYLVSSSDFNGDPWNFEKELRKFIEEAGRRDPIDHDVRLGVIGVPPIFNFYDFLEDIGAYVVYNETQSQFAMYFPSNSLEEQYTKYTYPYGIIYRLGVVEEEIKRRRIDGIIHYVQAFCHRRLEDVLIKKYLNVPVITIEGLEPHNLDGRIKLRLESFVEMIRDKKT